MCTRAISKFGFSRLLRAVPVCLLRWLHYDWSLERLTRTTTTPGFHSRHLRLVTDLGDSVLGENRSKLSDLHTNRSDYKAILDSSDSLLLLLTSPLTCFSSSSCLVGCWLGSEVPGVAWVKQRIIPRFHRMEICPNGATHPAWVCRACRCWNS